MSIVKPRNDGEAFFKPPREFKQRGPNGFPIGKQTEKRKAANEWMNKHLGLKECEIKIPGVCVKSIMLTWAHPVKTRFLVTKKDWRTAARCCLPCHQHIEPLSHEEMKRIVDESIARRPARLIKLLEEQ